MQHLEVSGAVRHIYIYIIRRLKVKLSPFTTPLDYVYGIVFKKLCIRWNQILCMNLMPGLPMQFMKSVSCKGMFSMNWNIRVNVVL